MAIYHNDKPYPVIAFQIGNLANDGHKLGRHMSVCSRDTPYVLREDGGGMVGSCHLFRHGGPTAPFVHLVIAFCLLVPKLLMEARLIEGGFLTEGKPVQPQSNQMERDSVEKTVRVDTG